MAEPVTLKLRQQDGVTLVGFGSAGILDVTTIQTLGRELYALVESAQHPRIVLDFTDVRFLSSQALGVLLMLHNKSKKAAAQVVLCGVRPELKRVFAITNLDKLFTFYETREAAVAALSPEK